MEPVVDRPERPTQVVDVVGPVCETGDFLAEDRPLPALQRDDLLAIFGAGAYGFSMSSNYNSRPRAAEVLVDGNQWHVIRQRESLTDLWAGESLLP
jgi:diaminopimelate decarboxylase